MKRRSDPLFCGPVVASPPGGQFLAGTHFRSEEHTSELQSQSNLVCRLLLEKKKKVQQRVVALSHLYRQHQVADSFTRHPHLLTGLDLTQASHNPPRPSHAED